MQGNWGGVDVGRGTFTDLDYADDAVLFTAHPDKRSEVLTDYEAAVNTFIGLHINWQKMTVQNIGAGPPPDAVQMGSQTVHPVTKFT